MSAPDLLDREAMPNHDRVRPRADASPCAEELFPARAPGRPEWIAVALPDYGGAARVPTQRGRPSSSLDSPSVASVRA